MCSTQCVWAGVAASARMAFWPLVGLMVCVVLVGGCAGVPRGPSTFEIPAGGYAATFEAAKAALIDARFELDRVDARSGVISAQPRRSVGLARPWDNQPSTPSQAIEEMMHSHSRVVRITIGPVPPPEDVRGTQAAPPPSPTDLRQVDEPLVGHVRVVVFRHHRPGWRADPSGVTLAGVSQDVLLTERGMWPGYTVAVRRDVALERRLAAAIRRRVGEESPTLSQRQGRDTR